MTRKLTALIVMDGFGLSDETTGNAIRAAGTPAICALRTRFPSTRIAASGMEVGLPEGQMGNSEVGHLNIGAGRIVYQELTLISKAIQDGSFFEKEALIWAMDAVKSGGSLHLMGLLSDGGVHSHNSHLYALLEMAVRRGLSRVYVHCFLDGRDVPPTSGIRFVEELDDEMRRIGTGRIATVMGRYYAMDRDNRWDRVERAYNAMVLGEGLAATSGPEAVRQSYDRNETDEFVQPTVVRIAGEPVACIQPGDSVIFYNFRAERAREITRTFTDEGFSEFPQKYGFFPLQFTTMTQYDKALGNLRIVNKPEMLDNTLGAYLASLGKSQLRIAETEKYAHVTFFFNGGVEAPNEGEERTLIPSPKVATYDLQPEMSALRVANEVISRILSGQYDFLIVNFANCDMVGHTGVFPAAVKAARVVDDCVGRVVQAVLESGGSCIVTADHGNAEQMIDPTTGGPFTAHTTNPVPFILCAPDYAGRALRENGKLADIAPTLLQLAGLDKPMEMTGKSLITEKAAVD